jgi:tyrosine-protein phosphatase MSG5
MMENIDNESVSLKHDAIPDVCQICGYTHYHEADSHPLSHITQILPNLFLGSRTNAQNIYEVRYFDIQTIINVALEIPRVCCDEFKYVKYNWDDIFCYDILSELDSVTDIMHSEISKGNNVLIHCAAGVSRSASAVIGYLMKYEKMDYDEAFTRVKSLRSCINPNLGFVDQLKIYGDKLSKENHGDGPSLTEIQ